MPSHHPVFDCLQCAQMEGEGLGAFIKWMIPVSTQGRQTKGGGGFKWKNTFEAFSCRINLCVEVSNIREAYKLLLIVQDEECMCETQTLVQEPLPSSIHLGRHWCHSCDNAPSPSPLFLLTASDDSRKAWGWGSKNYLENLWIMSLPTSEETSGEVTILLGLN